MPKKQQTKITEKSRVIWSWAAVHLWFDLMNHWSPPQQLPCLGKWLFTTYQFSHRSVPDIDGAHDDK